MTKSSRKTSPEAQKRPPVVVILGHVDHGKTSILDYIRQTKVAQGESGGITQHIGAYQVTLPPAVESSRGQQAEGSHAKTNEILRGVYAEQSECAQDDFSTESRKITFIDTPGHEAFSAMRSRGAKVADVAVLVVAADEGVKPQTKEAIGYILHLNLPFLVALNKMDKPTVLPDKVKKELADNGVLVESLGGKIPTVFVSAKTGLGINDLLEMILLLSEISQTPNSVITELPVKLPNSPNKHSVITELLVKLPNCAKLPNNDSVITESLVKLPNVKITELPNYRIPNASGIIIESRMDPKRGPIATLLVRQGLLKIKDAVAAESAFGQIKSMENFLGQKIEEAGPSTPALVFGFNQVPPVGEEWQTMPSLSEAKEKAEIKAEQEKHKREAAELFEIKPEQKVFNLILKADVSGSLEAIREALKTIPQEEILIRIIKGEVGDINENDVKLAESAKARIYGFRVKKSSHLDNLADRLKVRIATFEIIYELVQLARLEAGKLLEPEISQKTTGQIKILAVFKTEGRKQILGGRVVSGKAERGARAEVSRAGEKLGEGKITQLQQNKENVAEVQKDKECGLLLEGEVQVEKGDILELLKEERKKREL